MANLGNEQAALPIGFDGIHKIGKIHYRHIEYLEGAVFGGCIPFQGHINFPSGYLPVRPFPVAGRDRSMKHLVAVFPQLLKRPPIDMIIVLFDKQACLCHRAYFCVQIDSKSFAGQDIFRFLQGNIADGLRILGYRIDGNFIRF